MILNTSRNCVNIEVPDPINEAINSCTKTSEPYEPIADEIVTKCRVNYCGLLVSWKQETHSLPK